MIQFRYISEPYIEYSLAVDFSLGRSIQPGTKFYKEDWGMTEVATHT